MNIIQSYNKLGESPLWNYMNQTLYWVDIDDFKIKHQHDETGIIEHKLSKKPTCLALIDPNLMMVAVQDGIGIYDYRIDSYNYLAKIDDKNVRLNDGKCSKEGILQIGSMSQDEPNNYISNIQKYNNKSLSIEIPSIGTTNGIAFNSKNQMYYADSLRKSIYYNSSVFYTYENCIPDGATFDENDIQYICLWGGQGIDMFQDKNKFDHIELPCKQTTCCCYGGEHMTKLFVSSAYTNERDNGSIYILDTDKVGVKEHIFKS